MKFRMKGLYPKFMLLIGVFFIITVSFVVVFFYLTRSQQIEREVLFWAESHSHFAFKTIHSSLAQNGGVEWERQIRARLQEMAPFIRVSVISKNLGLDSPDDRDNIPQSSLERQVMGGDIPFDEAAIYEEDGHRIMRHVAPLFVTAQCQACHKLPSGAVIGIVSTDILLDGYESALRWQETVLVISLGSLLVILTLGVFLGLRRMVIWPLQSIQKGVRAIAQGDFSASVQIRTGDELEDLADGFNLMTNQLNCSFEAIVAERRKLMSAIEVCNNPIWISNAEQRVVMVNSAMEQITGKCREDFIGKECPLLFGILIKDGSSLCEAVCPFHHPAKNGSRFEGYLSDASGKQVWIEVSHGCVVNQAGSLTEVIHVIHDLTQRKEIERLKDEFLSLVSHELRIPLHHIKGFATTLLQTDVDWDADTQRDFLESINRESDRLADLISKILDLSRLEAGQLPMNKVQCEVADIINDTLQHAGGLVRGRQVVVNLPDNLPSVLVDGREIELVLTNIIENAVKYSAPGKSIWLGAKLEDGELIVAVQDKGRGIPTDQLECIFDRFYRIGEDTVHISGTGLGLAICKRIVEAHGGRIWAESTLRYGSCFFFSLPVN